MFLLFLGFILHKRVSCRGTISIDDNEDDASTISTMTLE
jgi:hypothetical protein